jgi:transcriptional regulator with AAA-type ATPase domain
VLVVGVAWKESIPKIVFAFLKTRKIHRAVNCGAIQKEQLTVNYSGHEKVRLQAQHLRVKVIFEADGGTLFLEVGELPLTSEIIACLLENGDS